MRKIDIIPKPMSMTRFFFLMMNFDEVRLLSIIGVRFYLGNFLKTFACVSQAFLLTHST